VSKLAELIEDGVGGGKLLDLRGIWARQSVSPALERQLLTIAEKVFQVIVNPEAGFQNVTEWCKKDLCWERVRATEIRLLPALLAELISKDDDRVMVRSGKKQQIVDTGIAAQTQVLELGGQYWSNLYSWAKKQNVLSVEQDRLLSYASQIPRKLPTDFQSERLLQIKGEMEGEGFAPTKSSFQN
jgi:hypothetical protein